MNEKKKKLVTIILSVVIGVLALGGLITAFILNYNVSSPSQVTILDDGTNIYITTSMNDNYSEYRFILKSGDQEIVINSQSNTLTVEQLLENGAELGQTYEITCQYISSTNQGGNSEISKPTYWTVIKYLTKPIVSVDENVVSWQEIENADYYMLYLNGEQYDFSFNLDTATFDLATLPGDKYQITVSAYSENDFYKTSPDSSQVTYEYYRYYQPFEEVKYDALSKKLICTGSEELSLLNVSVNGTVYEYKNFTMSQDEDKFIYEIDLRLFVDILSVGASPISIDKYNLYDGEIIFAEI